MSAERSRNVRARIRFLPLASVPGLPEIERAVEKEAPELDTAYKEAENLWKTAEDEFAKRAMAATREFPVLSMYASGPDAANQLEDDGSEIAQHRNWQPDRHDVALRRLWRRNLAESADDKNRSEQDASCEGERGGA